MTTPAVGGEIDSWCTKCKSVFNHTIVAKVGETVKRVQCLTCKGQHNFRATAPTTKTTSTKPRRPSTRKSAQFSPTDLTGPGRTYATTDAYSAGDVIDHTVLGRGQVATCRGNKIDVRFELGLKTLLHTPKLTPISTRGSRS